MLNVTIKNALYFQKIAYILQLLAWYVLGSKTPTIQGSRLGPILYAIYVSPLFDLEKMTNYADNN